MKRFLCAALVAALFALDFGGWAAGQEVKPPPDRAGGSAQASESSADLAAIRVQSLAFVAAFNAGDAKAVAGLWTETGDFTGDSGRMITGRDAIAKEYAALFAANPGAKIHITIDSLKLLSDSAAIEDGRAALETATSGAPATSKYTAVHVKVGGKWLMSTVRDSRIELPSAYRNVADLEWLIGTWTAEEHGAKTESVCRWVAGKSFVERKYTITHADGQSASGLQLIGWNPQGGHMQSWNFSSDGGHAVGAWTPREGGWSAEVQGVTGDGTPTTAVNTLTRLDDNAYVWQSVRRTAGGQSLPDTEEVVLKRSASK